MRRLLDNSEIISSCIKLGFNLELNEARLLILELLAKAGAGYYNSHTEELLIEELDLITNRRTPNKKGREFICAMVYASSNKRPSCFDSMLLYRR